MRYAVEAALEQEREDEFAEVEDFDEDAEQVIHKTGAAIQLRRSLYSLCPGMFLPDEALVGGGNSKALGGPACGGVADLAAFRPKQGSAS